jgi:MarR family transcriptional regulator, lower aerobic nicotinate degradation pathway regulator
MATTPHVETLIKAPAARPPRELLSSPTFLLKHLTWAMKEQKLAAFEPTGLNPMHYAVLALLDEGARETQATIADALGYDRGYLVGLLDELEDRDLIERRRDPDDRRRHLVKLTTGGKEQLTKLRSVLKRFEKEFLAPLDTQERETLLMLLRRVAAQHDERFANGS